MNARDDRVLIEKLKSLPPEQRAEVEDFVDFLTTKTRKRAALDRLLAIAPVLEAAGVAPMSEEEIDAEVKAVRAERSEAGKRLLDAMQRLWEAVPPLTEEDIAEDVKAARAARKGSQPR